MDSNLNDNAYNRIGAEDKILAEQGAFDSQLKLMIQSAGKLVLIDKLLPRLKSAGHKV